VKLSYMLCTDFVIVFQLYTITREGGGGQIFIKLNKHPSYFCFLEAVANDEHLIL
jgi:hypothetical protein